MNNDGYDIGIVDKTVYVKKLYDDQIKLLDTIDNVVDEMEKLPPLEGGIEGWIDSLGHIDDKNPFQLKDYKKLFKLNKNYEKLKEQREINTRKIKIALIDNILERIKRLL